MTNFFKFIMTCHLTLLTVAVVTLMGASVCHAASVVSFSDDRLSISVDNEPLIPLLEKIANQANLVVFVSKGFAPKNVSVHMENQPLEKALDRILKGFNVARIYNERSGQPYLTAIKIYPKGVSSGPLDVVIQATVPESETPFALQGRKYRSQQTDVLHPQEYVHTVEYDTLVSAAMEFEKIEQTAWDDIQTLKDQVNDEVDETRNEVLSLALLDKYEAFEQMQKTHIDTLEKMHRIEHFRESRANQDKQNNEGLQ